MSVSGLRKSYGETVALRDIDLLVRRGAICALLGPNGAGKTTIVEILAGLRRRDAGAVTVLGHDPQRDGKRLRQIVGVMLQGAGIEPDLRVGELLRHTAALYQDSRDVSELLDELELGPRSKAAVRTLSGGERRRLELALALVGKPKLIFLDEPTAGLDPASRRQAWDMLEAARRDGAAILLTGHAIDEIQRHADSIVIIKSGVVVRAGTVPQLMQARFTQVAFRMRADSDPPPPYVFTRDDRVERRGREWIVRTTEPVKLVRDLTYWSTVSGARLDGLQVMPPALEDVYLELLDDTVVST